MTRSPARRLRAAATTTAVALAGPALLLAGPALLYAADADAAARPDLAVTAVANPPAKVLVGDGFRLRDTTANGGRGRAGASATRFYLTGDPKRSFRERRTSRTHPRTAAGDLLLAGAREVPALRGGSRSKARRATVVRVPVGTRPGTYRLLACADDRGAVKEAVEHDNCRVAKRAVTVVARPDEPTELAAMSDTFEQPQDADDRDAIGLFTQATCAVAPTAPKRMTVRGAVGSLRAALTAQAGADAMKAFAASPEYRSAPKAQAASVAALTAGHPGAALAALLRAHELQPRRAAHLRNAAAVAVSLGRPSEALALLDGAARLDDGPLAGMGIAPRAVAQTVRGQALGMLGRWNEARPLLQSALDGEPLLAEAADGLAAASACAKDPEKAFTLTRRARQRRGTAPPPWDTSRGQEHALRKLVLPFSPEQAAPMRDVYRAESESLGSETMALVGRRNEHEANLRKEEPTATRASVKRRKATFSRIYNAHEEPDVAAARKRYMDLADAPHETARDFFGNADQEHKVQKFADTANSDCQGTKDYSACYDARMKEQCIPALRLAHQTWADQMTDLWRAADAAHRLLSKRISAYGAHLAGPQAQALVRVTIEEDELATYGLVRSSTIVWTVGVKLWEDYCVSAPEPTAPNPEQAGAAGSEECSPFLKGVNIVAKLDDWSLKVSCEKVEIGGSLKAAPWLAGFAKATYDPRAGKMTIFAGSQAQIDNLKVVKGAFRSGVYLTVSQQGIEDVGWRTGPSATAGAGPAEVQIFKDEIDMSFVSGLNATFGR